jgi:hypothetical protein
MSAASTYTRAGVRPVSASIGPTLKYPAIRIRPPWDNQYFVHQDNAFPSRLKGDLKKSSTRHAVALFTHGHPLPPLLPWMTDRQGPEAPPLLAEISRFGAFFDE